ncbi:hypothetical protein [Actinomadura algeriensis]|uniref:Uncharacterized protein n=1 Tax=Actinomadura algeriensis TaxID=1679523 RepID=A0ABR9JIP8_9ACTN|nr:hypothetical protein [Actinomadura algeriensis]MBE1530407.1 hypothetical protein [Actinomadura algeriensis]
MNDPMRNLSISDQSWTMQSEAAEAQQSEATEEFDVSAEAEFERNLNFNYARI